MRRPVIVLVSCAVGVTSLVVACSGGIATVPGDQTTQQLQKRLDGTPTGNGKTCSWEGTAVSSAPSGQATYPVGPYNVGDSFKSLDGCNDCTCSAQGIMCTVRACSGGPTPAPTTGGPPQGCTTEAKVCPDGSAVGRSGPSCEFAACPTPTPSGACFTATGDLDPSMRKCATTADCTIVTYTQNCCGTMRSAGVNKASQSRAQTCGNDREKGFPACGCASQGGVADDGSSSLGTSGPTGASAKVSCSAAGLCTTTFTGGTTLKWYSTCGYPVCRAPSGADAGTTVVCPKEGSSCTTRGDTCGTASDVNCGSILVCDDHDPKTAGCPISTQKAKDDIAYVDSADLQRLHDETLSMRLATYRYKGPFIDPKDPSAKHLGFIIEDQPQSLSVDRLHDRVDLYGYMSMAVATMQVQEKEIAELRKELSAVKATCSKAK
jgi:hypothetical protein